MWIQLTPEFITSASALFLAACGVVFQSRTTSNYQPAVGFTAVTSVYLGSYLAQRAGLSPVAICVISPIVCAPLSLICVWLSESQGDKGRATWQVMAKSLGVGIIIQATLAITTGEQVRQIVVLGGSLKLFGVRWSAGQAAALVCASFFGAILGLLLYQSRYGREWRGSVSNEMLARIFGVNVSRIRNVSLVLAAISFSFAAIIEAERRGVTPGFGFGLYLAGATVAIVGGQNRLVGLAASALLFAFLQQSMTFTIGSEWTDALVFAVLVLFLIWKPLGFSGRQLKKVEV